MITRLRPVLAAALLALAAGCGGEAANSGSGGGESDSPVVVSPTTGPYSGSQFADPVRRPGFTLTDTTGARYDFAARTAGRATFLFFGYTHCPDICPATMANVATALREVPVQLRSKVDVVFVTTDPARDTPQVIGDWLRHFDADLPRRFTGLSGTAAQVRAAQRAANVPLAMDMGQTHSTQVLLFGPDDLARVFYLDGNSPSDMSHDLPLIIEG